MSVIGHGDFENVRVNRERVISEFPIEAPPAIHVKETLPPMEEVRSLIRAAVAENGGFIGQKDGAEIVRRRYPSIARNQVRRLIKEVTGNAKPGPERTAPR